MSDTAIEQLIEWAENRGEFHQKEKIEHQADLPGYAKMANMRALLFFSVAEKARQIQRNTAKPKPEPKRRTTK